MFEIKGKKKAVPGPRNKPVATALNVVEFEQFEKYARENNLKNSELLRQMILHCLNNVDKCDKCGEKPQDENEKDLMFQSGLCNDCFDLEHSKGGDI